MARFSEGFVLSYGKLLIEGMELTSGRTMLIDGFLLTDGEPLKD
jgi:hypothetical protein